MLRKGQKHILLLLLILVLTVLLAACSASGKNSSGVNEQAQDTSWQRVQNNNKLVVGLCAAYPPFESRNEKTGELEGFDVDLANALGE